jgi:hypothetical protein
MNANHSAKHDELQGWIAEKESYLNHKEDINSVSEAQTQISLLEEYEKEKISMAGNYVSALKQLGLGN